MSTCLSDTWMYSSSVNEIFTPLNLVKQKKMGN